ncbi:MAG TPA: hypothetical protein VEW66_05015, partial [Thermomicrobiales bacterium]|nr:hypothetical protein [Thermomicrobiales bacterium]
PPACGITRCSLPTLTKVDPAGIVRLGVTGDDVRSAAWPELPDDVYAGAQVPEVISRDKQAAAAEHIPAGRTTMAAIREDEPSIVASSICGSPFCNCSPAVRAPSCLRPRGAAAIVRL